MGSEVPNFTESSSGPLLTLWDHMKAQSKPEHLALAHRFPNAPDLTAALWVIWGETLRGTRRGEGLLFSNWTVQSVGWASPLVAACP